MQPRNRHHTFILIACFSTVYLVWGSTFLGQKIAVAKIPPLLVSGSRFSFAGFVLLGILSALGKVEWKSLLHYRHWRTAAVTGFLMLFCANGLLSSALKREIPSGIAALIVGSTPMWMVTFDRMQTRRGVPSLRVMAGMLVGIAGVATLVSGAIFSQVQSEHVDFLGAMMVLVSAIFWSGGSIVGRTMPQPREAMLGSAMQMIMGGAMLLLLSLIMDPWKPVAQIPWNDPAWIAFGYLAIFGSLISFTAYMWLIHNTSAAAVATYAYVNPLVAMLLGWLMLDERLNPRTGFATLLILGGVVLLQRGGTGHAQHKK